MDNKVTSPTTKGVIISLILIVYSLVLQFAHQAQNKGLGSISMLIFVGAIIWAGVSFSNQMNHQVTYGNVFGHSFKAVATVTVIMIVFTIISTKFLFPETIDLAVENARAEMERSGQPEETVDKAVELSRKFFIPFAIGGILLIYMLVGVIASLIGAAVAKKTPTDPFTQPG